MENKILLAYATFPDKSLAESAAKIAVSKGHAAGVNLMGPIHSIYRWQGVLRERDEWLMLAQISASAFAAFESLLGKLHPDITPCLITMPIEQALPAFRDWILENSQ